MPIITLPENNKKLSVPAGTNLLNALKENNPEAFLFFNKMRSPVGRIQNKFRYQVLMRLAENSVLPQIYQICAGNKSRDVLVSVEENPGSLA